MTTIDLNCDIGEATEPDGIEREARLIGLVSSVNIACAGHAGDDESMRRTVEVALDAGCAIGAHPSYPDRERFGRVRLTMNADALHRELREQIHRLGTIARASGADLSHIKPHGALYHACADDPAVAGALASAARSWRDGIVLVGGSATAALEHWRELGAIGIGEAFADRVYEAGGRLRSRSEPDALILDPDAAARQAVSIATEGRVRAHGGSWVSLRAQTLCVHSDTPGSERIAAAVRRALEDAGVEIGRTRRD